MKKKGMGSNRQRLEVGTAGALFRLSARLLLSDVTAGHVVLDFRGVEDIGDEFLEEIFVRWAADHPKVTIEIVNLTPGLMPRMSPHHKPGRTAG